MASLRSQSASRMNNVLPSSTAERGCEARSLQLESVAPVAALAHAKAHDFVATARHKPAK